MTRQESKRIRSLLTATAARKKTYAAMVKSLDENIGRVAAGARRERLASNTLSSSPVTNGGERFSNVWPFSGMKQELLEGGIRIPAIVRWPGRIALERCPKQVMITMDWMPTLLAAAGTSPDAAYPSDGGGPRTSLDWPHGDAPRKVVLALLKRDRSVPSATAIGNICG